MMPKTSFKSRVRVNMDFMDVFGVDVYDATANITWDLEFEVREWGIKYTMISVPEQHLVIEGYYYDKNDDWCLFEKTIRIEDMEIEFEDDWDWKFGMRPREIEQYKTEWTMRF